MTQYGVYKERYPHSKGTEAFYVMTYPQKNHDNVIYELMRGPFDILEDAQNAFHEFMETPKVWMYD